MDTLPSSNNCHRQAYRKGHHSRRYCSSSLTRTWSNTVSTRMEEPWRLWMSTAHGLQDRPPTRTEQGFKPSLIEQWIGRDGAGQPLKVRRPSWCILPGARTDQHHAVHDQGETSHTKQGSQDFRGSHGYRAPLQTTHRQRSNERSPCGHGTKTTTDDISLCCETTVWGNSGTSGRLRLERVDACLQIKGNVPNEQDSENWSTSNYRDLPYSVNGHCRGRG
jgi:hypothetical protein